MYKVTTFMYILFTYMVQGPTSSTYDVDEFYWYCCVFVVCLKKNIVQDE